MPCQLCGSQENAQRKQMKALLAELEQQHPTLRQTMLAAIGNVNLSHLYDRDAVTSNRRRKTRRLFRCAWSADRAAGAQSSCSAR